MSLTFFFKNNLNRLPIGIEMGKHVAKIPYKFRPGIGQSYTQVQKDIKTLEENPKTKEQYVFEKLKNLTQFAYENTYFYKTYYDRKGFNPDSLKSFKDLQRIPITNKTLFQKYSLEERSTSVSGLSKSNTGGSSGKPLTFYTDPYAIGNEWAHLHKIWGTFEYKPSSLKMILAGRSNIQNGVQYDLLRHSLVVDIYKDFNNIYKDLLKYSSKNKIHFLHGYPSALYELALYCDEDGNEQLKENLRKTLKGVFLNSEFPFKDFRNKIEDVFEVKTLSFYGHTERCIMAYEDSEKYNFKVFQSYGFAEVIENSLVGTSYYSFGTPLIRYDTEDAVENFEYREGFLETFSLKEGRKGDYVIDEKGKKIPVTGLVFGRHHKLFEYCKYLQFKQLAPGVVKVFYTTNKNISPKEAARMFDSNNVLMEFEFEKLSKPIKTISGKVSLRIN